MEGASSHGLHQEDYFKVATPRLESIALISQENQWQPKGKNNVKAYFPVGESSPWQHIWTGKLYTDQGSESWVESPIGQPAVFVKAGSLVGETFLKNLRNLNIF